MVPAFQANFYRTGFDYICCRCVALATSLILSIVLTIAINVAIRIFGK